MKKNVVIEYLNEEKGIRKEYEVEISYKSKEEVAKRMIQVKKTLYITEPNLYLHCNNSSLEIRKDCQLLSSIPCTAIEQIIFLNNTTISSCLVKWCNENGIRISYISEFGQYYGRIEGFINGNVLLRKQQYLMIDTNKSIKLIQNILLSKFLNSIETLKWSLNNADKCNSEYIRQCIDKIKILSSNLFDVDDIDKLRGLEGTIATIYYSCFDKMLKIKDKEMLFVERSRRPSKNNVNALLNLLYTLTTRDCVAALESNGLDSYCGYLHELRSGRESLACDLVEELRSSIVDRFVIKNINLSKITSKEFEEINRECKLTDDGRKKVLKMWSEYKEENTTYGFENKKYPIKIIPYLQARLIAEYIRGDIEEYPPWVWKG